jgi:hypothetical protein
MGGRRGGDMTVGSEEQYFFIHLQKTAGTSLIRRMRSAFGPEGVFPDESDLFGDTPADRMVGAVIDVDNLVRRWAARRDEIRVVTGHFPFCTAELLGGRLRTFTVLREPVARTLSYLRHHRARTPDDQQRSLEDIYSDPLRFHGLAHNHMTKMFSLTVDEMTAGMLTHVEFTPERLERARANLARVDVVGIQERFERFCDDLARRFGWDLGDAVRANATEPTDVDPVFVERIAADNAMDIELYDFAVRLVDERAVEVEATR